MAKAEELTTDDKFMMLMEILAQRKEEGISAETLQKLLANNTEAMQKAMKPENQSPPLHSSMAYPEGDRDKPRENILTKEFVYYGFPMSKFPESSHWWELELAEQVEPGTYRVMRKDGSLMVVEAKGEYSATGKLTKIAVDFSVSREEKNTVPPVPVVLYQMVHQGDTQKVFVEAMHKYLDVMVMGQMSAA